MSDEMIYAYARQAWHRYGRPAHRSHRFPPHRARTDHPLETFARLLVDGADGTSVTQTVEIVGDAPRSRVVQVVDLDRANLDGDDARSEPVVVVPIRCRRRMAGEPPLAESLEVSTAAGDRLPPLPTELTTGLVAYTLAKLFQLQSEVDPEVPLTPDQTSALYDVVRLVCHDAPVDRARLAAAVDRAVAALPGITPGGRDRLARLASSFVETVVVAVEARGSVDLVRACSEHVVTPGGRLASGHDRCRVWLGLPPFRYRIPVEWPFFARRYRLRISGPPGQFVYRHGLSVESGRMMRPDEVRAWERERPPVRVEVHPDVGLPYAELTVTGAHRVPAARAECVVEFEEVPPGALGRTVLMSAVGSVLLLAFAFLLPRLARSSGDADPAVLLAAVGFLASMLGQSTERVRGSSVTTVAGLAATAAIALLGPVLYLVCAALGGPWTPADLPFLAGVPVPRVDLVWSALGALSLGITGMLAVRWRHRTRRYLDTLGRRDGATSGGGTAAAIPAVPGPGDTGPESEWGADPALSERERIRLRALLDTPPDRPRAPLQRCVPVPAARTAPDTMVGMAVAAGAGISACGPA